MHMFNNKRGQSSIETSFVLIYVGIIMAGLIFFYDVFTEMSVQNFKVRESTMAFLTTSYASVYDKNTYPQFQGNYTGTDKYLDVQNESEVEFTLYDAFLFGEDFKSTATIQQHLYTYLNFNAYDGKTVSETEYNDFVSTKYPATINQIKANINSILQGEANREASYYSSQAGAEHYISESTAATYYP